MFRRLPDSLPEDPRFKADMKAMGYFVNENSQIRKSKNPNEKFHYFITNNTRWNEMHREAMESCIRREVAKRSLAQGVGVLYLPQMTASDPKAPSVPIFLTPPHQLKQKKRVFVIVNGARQDLGQWAYRTTFGEGIVAGSCVSLLQELREREDVGMIIANSGQLLYSHKFNQAMTDRSWNARPRTSAVHPVVYADAKHNHVPDNEDVEAHFKFILDNLALNEEYVDKDAEVYVIGIESGGDAALKVLDTHWPTYSPRITAIALAQPFWHPRDTTNPSFSAFLTRRARAWRVDTSRPRNACAAIPAAHKPSKSQIQKNDVANSTAETEISDTAAAEDGLADLTLQDPNDGTGVPDMVFDDVAMPTFAAGWAGEFATETECVFVECWRDVLAWFEEVNDAAGNKEGYENPVFEVAEMVEEVEFEEEGGEVKALGGAGVSGSGNAASATVGAEVLSVDGSTNELDAGEHRSFGEDVLSEARDDDDVGDEVENDKADPEAEALESRAAIRKGTRKQTHKLAETAEEKEMEIAGV